MGGLCFSLETGLFTPGRSKKQPTHHPHNFVVKPGAPFHHPPAYKPVLGKNTGPRSRFSTDRPCSGGGTETALTKKGRS